MRFVTRFFAKVDGGYTWWNKFHWWFFLERVDEWKL